MAKTAQKTAERGAASERKTAACPKCGKEMVWVKFNSMRGPMGFACPSCGTTFKGDKVPA